MSPLHFVIMLIIAIIILTVLTLKFKMHPVMVLFLTATFCGLASGKTLVDTFAAITKYFGSTLGSIGVMIIFGAVIASGINDTGAATSMVNFFIKKFKGKCLELAPSLTGFIMSIPVFGDIAIILNAPISAILAKRKKLGMQQVAPFVNLGLTLTHGLVPPTPGILAVSILLGADIAFVNGGGVRADINAGDITYGDIINVHPFGNSACLVEVTGQQLKDALELGSAAYPGESGGFLQVSGLTYTINADIPSSVVKNDKSEFVKVDGAYRVSDIMVGGQPLDVNKTYTLASHNYMLKDAGDGYTMFGTKNVKVLQDEVMIDNQVLINYIVEKLGGVVGEQYAAPQGRITIKTAASDVPTNESDKVIAGRDTTVTEGDTYTVVAGDCLWNIAYKLYGTGTLYTKLAEANKLADPYIIYIGQILTVPAK